MLLLSFYSPNNGDPVRIAVTKLDHPSNGDLVRIAVVKLLQSLTTYATGDVTGVCCGPNSTLSPQCQNQKLALPGLEPGSLALYGTRVTTRPRWPLRSNGDIAASQTSLRVSFVDTFLIQHGHRLLRTTDAGYYRTGKSSHNRECQWMRPANSVKLVN